MRKLVPCLVAVLCLLAGTAGAANEGRFLRYPDIHGNRIVFTYEGDLWLADTEGTPARRITSAPGVEYAAKFSPDGKWIAFTAGYDGTPAVYVIPSEGGEPTRLTYIPGPAQTVCWTPDGERVVFRSGFEQSVIRDPNLYFVSRKGSAPERFPFERGVLCSFSADGRSILYSRKGQEEYYWKRYKGGRYQDIWRYDFTTNSFTPVSDYVGKNSYPLWVGNTMVFVSDRTNGIANLYVQDLSTKTITPLTKYEDFDVMMPSTDGKQLVYVHGGYLYLMSLATGESRRLTMNLASDRWLTRERSINPAEYIHSVDIAGDGKNVVVEARGDLFVAPTGPGTVANLTNSPGTREMYPRISPDGKWIAFFSDRTGEYQLYLQRVGGGEWTPLTTTLDRTCYHPVWSPDGTKILFGDKDLSLFVLEVQGRKLTQIDGSNQLKNDEFTWEMSDYGWSPDGKWVCYTQVQANRNSVVFLYSLEQKKKFDLTGDFFDNLYPAFDANGRYLYYVASRNFDIQMDFLEDNHVLTSPQQVMVVQLQDGERPPFAEKAEGEKPAAAAPFRIDTENLQKRTYPLPVPPGQLFFLSAGKGKVFWCTVPKFTAAEYSDIFRPSGGTKWDLHIFDMDQKKEAVLPDKIREYRLSTNGEQIAIRKENDIFATSVEKASQAKGLGDKLSLNGMRYLVNTQQEWNQIFSDAWRWYRDFFYDPGMHGRDWKAMGDKYRAFIPSLSSRQELNWVLEQMVGELCVSHTYIGGGDAGIPPAATSPVFTGWLGADLSADGKTGLYRLSKIFGPTEYNRSLVGPLVRPDMDIREGDYLIAINGTTLKVPDDYNRLLQVTQDQKVTVAVNHEPSMAGARTYEVTPIRNDPSLRYFRWLTDNVNYVLKASSGKVGYMHINAMGAGGIAEFEKFWRAFRNKEGIIIDVRRNSGGWTEYFLIDKLERKMVAYNVLKNMVPFRYPGGASSAQYVALSNEYNGSDGEAFIEHFKARKLGPVIGVPSWGGLVGIVNTQLTVDNGTVEQSNNAFYGAEGKWLVENHGADPDIVLDNDPASVAAGKDLQLDKAIEVVLQRIRENPFTFPPRPPYPKK
jgi:tricorn protease